MTVELHSPIRAVTFDVGGTLIEPWPSVGHVYAKVAARNGIGPVSPALLNERFREAWSHASDFGYRREDWEAIVTRTFSGLVSSVSPFFHELYDRFAEPDAWHVFDDVRPTLEWLRDQGIPCAVVSNWDERLRVLLQRLNLEMYFDAAVISCEIGATKPDARIFAEAARQLRVDPGSILHAGDCAIRDVAGATRAGFRAVRVDRGTGVDAGAIGSLTILQRLVSTD